MKVILLNNIRGVGQVGDIKTVTDGYARNFLFPHKLAKLANAANEKESETLKQKRVIFLEKERKMAQEAADRLKDRTFEFSEKAGETGTLFAAVSRKDIIRKIRDVTGIELTDDMVSLPEHLKTIGEHKVDLKLSSEVSMSVNISIRPEK